MPDLFGITSNLGKGIFGAIVVLGYFAVGGFIMTATCLDEAAPENVKAMIDTTKSYGRYD